MHQDRAQVRDRRDEMNALTSSRSMKLLSCDVGDARLRPERMRSNVTRTRTDGRASWRPTVHGPRCLLSSTTCSNNFRILARVGRTIDNRLGPGFEVPNMGSAQYQLEDDASSGARLLPTLLPSRQTRPDMHRRLWNIGPADSGGGQPWTVRPLLRIRCSGPFAGPESTVSAGGYLHVSGRSTSATWPGATDTSRDGEVGRDRCACRGVRPGQGQAGGEFAACAFQVTGGQRGHVVLTHRR